MERCRISTKTEPGRQSWSKWPNERFTTVQEEREREREKLMMRKKEYTQQTLQAVSARAQSWDRKKDVFRDGEGIREIWGGGSFKKMHDRENDSLICFCWRCLRRWCSERRVWCLFSGFLLITVVCMLTWRGEASSDLGIEPFSVV